MKVTVASLFALPVVAAAFVPQACQPAFSSTRLLSSVVTTGPGGKAATSAEEDLMLTLRIIMDHDSRSTTVSKEQFIVQMGQAQNAPASESIDISIPYDAAAKLAYEALVDDNKMRWPYEDFKKKYEADAIALVKSKRPVDISIPYDAAAKLAYDASDKSMAYADFKTKYEADAVADVIAKKPVDISIPYDAAAKLAYAASDKSMAYADFKTKYEADAVADVIAKQTA
jgi:hypothetical protein